MTSEQIIYLISIILLLVFSGVFSASETAYTSLNLGKVETLIDQKKIGAKLIKKQYKNFNHTLTTILICNNVVNIASSTLTTIFLQKINVPANILPWISILAITAIVVIFGEILPKLIAKAYPVKVARVFCFPLEILFHLLWPITFPLGLMGKKIYITNSEEDVKNLIDVAQNEGVLEANESIMAQNALDLDSEKVKKHYIKLKDVSYIPSNSSLKDAFEIFKVTNYSRLPIEKDGEFIGIVHLKDIFFLQKGKVINYLKTIPYVSANSNLSSALEKMKLKRAQMAFVTQSNQSSKVIGIITIEDILEEVVGEIYDEYDDDELEDFFEISLELYRVSSHVLMKDIIKTLEIELDIDESELKLSLHEWLSTKIEGNVIKNSKYSQNNITFKVLTSPGAGDKTKKGYKVEVELGHKAGTLELDIDSKEIKE
ncbi:CNNM domain-containing protein [Mycoplasma sp. Mirounga ES2805-ORL]|uniref:CNNM domain-containing protein n=1 Tax=Mycoplasma sp. Mirounga ES2805-ORL TaxID=754514 RepID=UPI00197B7F7E|nr:hemolysin family protein [Mycoplasma sp. Mirounga ES2805-ORL]QSF13585.1 HlyC/CorC family transporter [Mycoplasma sp. Mirounga ES2805-ORL]